VNDPWPTPFDTGGFDFDAVGVIHNMTDGIPGDTEPLTVVLYPNPLSGYARFRAVNAEKTTYSIFSVTGALLLEGSFSSSITLDLSFLSPGIYTARTTNQHKTSVIKFCKH
jgi:hypothetical protein